MLFLKGVYDVLKGLIVLWMYFWMFCFAVLLYSYITSNHLGLSLNTIISCFEYFANLGQYI